MRRLDSLRYTTRSPVGHHQRLEQRVTGQTIRAMQPRARNLPCGKQARDFSFAVDVRNHPTTLVVRCRNHGYRLASHIEAKLQAG